MLMLHDPEKYVWRNLSNYDPRVWTFCPRDFVLDEKGVIRYEEIVPEISQEPDYQSLFDFQKKFIVE